RFEQDLARGTAVFLFPEILPEAPKDRKSTRLNSSHQINSYAVFCLKKQKLPDGYLEKLPLQVQQDNIDRADGAAEDRSPGGAHTVELLPLLLFSYRVPPTTETYTLSLHDALPI